MFATYKSIPRYWAKSEMDMVNNSSNVNPYFINSSFRPSAISRELIIALS
jgi:hypothetical protein